MTRMTRLHCSYIVMLYPAVICTAAGSAHAESGWGDSGQLPLLSNGQGPQQELPDIAQGFLSLCVAHPEHGGKVRQGMYMAKHKKIYTCTPPAHTHTTPQKLLRVSPRKMNELKVSTWSQSQPDCAVALISVTHLICQWSLCSPG